MTLTTWIGRACGLAWLGLVPGLAQAQDVVTLEQAVQGSLVHNARLASRRAQVAAAASQVDEARAAWYPRVSVSESWQRGNQPLFVFSSLLAARQFTAADFALASLNHPDPIGAFRALASIEQPLFDGGRRKAEEQRARLQHETAGLALDEATAQLIATTTETYGRVLVAESARRAAGAALESARQDRVRAEQRRDAGTGTDADVLALAAREADLQQRALQYDGDAAVARAELNRLRGVPIDEDYRVGEPPPLLRQPETTLAALLAEADANRPELRQAAAMLRLAQADSRAARSALLPQVVTQAAVDASGTSIGDRATGWVVGGEARWSLSLGGAEAARIKAAADGRTRAQAEADDVRAGVHVEVVTAYRRRQSAAARLEAGRAAVAQARESERIVRDRFEAGLASVNDVLRASSAVLDAEAQRTSAMVDAMVSDAMLTHAVGRHP